MKNKEKQHGETETVHETKRKSYFRNRKYTCIDDGIEYTVITLKTTNKNIT